MVRVNARGAQATQKVVRMRTKPETEVIHARGLPIYLVRNVRILLAPLVTASDLGKLGV